MMFPVAVVGNNIKEQLKPYWKLINERWNDVTHHQQKYWRMNSEKESCPETFVEWLDMWKIPPWEKLPEDPFFHREGYILENGEARVYNYANPKGYWSHYDIGENYTDFFLLKNGETSFQAIVDDIDLKKDIRDVREKLAIRWDNVRKAAEKEVPKPWNCSRALKMNKHDYIELRTAEYIVPDAMVWQGFAPPDAWLWLEKMPPAERLATYINIMRELPPDAKITIVECHT